MPVLANEAVIADVPVKEYAQPVVALGVGSAAYLACPLAGATVTRTHFGEALPRESCHLIEIDKVILATLETLPHLCTRLVGNVRNINPCAAWKISPWFAALRYGNALCAENFLYFIKHTTTRLQVAQVVAEENGTKFGV